ncbi:MAG: hypothetical protein ACK56F_15035, partial [bacterium]
TVMRQSSCLPDLCGSLHATLPTRTAVFSTLTRRLKPRPICSQSSGFQKPSPGRRATAINPANALNRCKEGSKARTPVHTHCRVNHTVA